MKKIFFTAVSQIFLMSFLFSKCQAQQAISVNLEEAKTAIALSNGIYFQALANGDSSLFVNCYATDCWIMPPNAPALCDVGAPFDFFRTVYNKIGIRNGKFISIDIFGGGAEFVTELGFWQSFDANNKLIDNGKFLVLWKKTPEGWKRFRDTFNSDQSK